MTTKASSDSAQFLSRQLKVPDWNQGQIEDTVALVLGAGGAGSTISIALCRLGVKKIFLVDMDIVEPSNLNRQLLFHRKHVEEKRRKVDAAKEVLMEIHATARNTEIVALHCNAVTEWGEIMRVAGEEATVVFNGIDVGKWFDLAVASFALKRSIPYLAGSVFANNCVMDVYLNNKPDAPCWQCAGNIEKHGHDQEKIKLYFSPEKIMSYASLADIVTSDVKPETGSIGSQTCVVTSGLTMLVEAWLRGMQTGKWPTWTKIDYTDWCHGVVQFTVEKDPNCLLCGPSVVVAKEMEKGKEEGKETPKS